MKLNHLKHQKNANPRQRCGGKYIYSFKIASSAFNKVVPQIEQNKLFKKLPSLLQLSNNLSNYNLKNYQEIPTEKISRVFEEIY